MPRPRKKAATPAPRARNTHSRQRQRLIDACIAALHLYGPSHTTVEKVVGIAKMSPGIVRFYFASKAAMLVASLQFLAAEFEQQLMVPVSRLKSRPVEALELLVELYIDPEIATARKVSVWYSFWGEASSRQEYYDICGQKDESFAALVRELIERLIIDTGQTHLDADGVALGLIGVLEILWQDFAFQDESAIDRGAAKRRAMAYLRSVFPGQFGVTGAPGTGVPVFRPWTLDNARLAVLERSNIFQTSWQLVGLRSELRRPGDCVVRDLGAERAVVLMDDSGTLRALRNSCPMAPHALVGPGAGPLQAIACAAHGLRFDLAGHRLAGSGADLTALELLTHDTLLLVRTQSPRSETSSGGWEALELPADAHLVEVSDRPVAADWKLVAEALFGGDAVRYLGPNHWINVGEEGFSVLQLLPVAPGRSLLRRYRCSTLPEARRGRVARYLAERRARFAGPSALALAVSVQQGVTTFGYTGGAGATPAIDAFRRELVRLLPLLAYERPPGET